MPASARCPRPQRTGGGVAFGPKPRRYTVKVNRKERRRALRAALSVHADRGSLAAVDAEAFDAPSTKQAAEALAGFGDGGRALVVLVEGEENAALSRSATSSGVTVLHADDVGRRRRDRRRPPGRLAGAVRAASPSVAAAPRARRRSAVNPRSVIIRPVISEKSYALLAANKYTFRVHDDAPPRRRSARRSRQIFGVRVQDVRTQNVKPKPKRRGFHSGNRRAVEEGHRDAAPRGLDRAVRGPGER